jgi:hypothetical protein
MPFAWIIIVVLFWIISSASKIRKNQAAQAKQKDEKEKARQKTAEQYARRQAQSKASPQPAAPAMSSRDDWEDEEENWDQRDAQRARPAMASQPVQPVRPAPVKRHETKPLEAHMHTPVMGTEGTGTEGEDCCHEFMLDQRPEDKPADFLPLQEETEALRAKALLQGVIFSEVLGRRPVRRYGTRRA